MDSKRILKEELDYYQDQKKFWHGEVTKERKSQRDYLSDIKHCNYGKKSLQYTNGSRGGDEVRDAEATALHLWLFAKYRISQIQRRLKALKLPKTERL